MFTNHKICVIAPSTSQITHHIVEEIKVGNLRLSIEQRTEIWMLMLMQQ